MVEFIKGAYKKEEYPISLKEIVFVGRSNVGKSSLINALYNQKIAYVGKTPGKTRMLNFFNKDDEYTICDVPGYGFAKRSEKEQIQFGNMMEEYFTNRNVIKLVVCIRDCRIKPTVDDIDMEDYLKAIKLPYIIVYNKIDKLTNSELIALKRENNGFKNINYVSSFKKTNISELKETINQYLYY